MLCKLLLCKEDKRVYNIKDKSLVKLLSRSWNCSQGEMVTDLELGDASETARKVIFKNIFINKDNYDNYNNLFYSIFNILRI